MSEKIDEFVLGVTEVQVAKSRLEADDTDGGGTGRGDTNS